MTKNILVSLIVLSGLGVSCGMHYREKSMKADIASRARKDISFAGVEYTVKSDTIYLGGNIASEQARKQVLEKVNWIAGVKYVVDRMVPGPTPVDSAYWLRRSVDSVMKDYPQATVVNAADTMVLVGSISARDKEGLQKKLKGLQVPFMRDELVVRP